MEEYMFEMDDRILEIIADNIEIMVRVNNGIWIHAKDSRADDSVYIEAIDNGKVLYSATVKDPFMTYRRLKREGYIILEDIYISYSKKGARVLFRKD